MNAHFSFSIDRTHGLVRIAMGGLFGPADIAAFLEARREAHAALGLGPNQHMTLNDLREMKIQSQDAVALFQRMLADPAERSRRLAFVAPPTLARAQLMRAVQGRDCRCFDTPEEAEAWLTGADEGWAEPERRAANG